MTTKDRFKSIFRSKPSGDDPIYGHPRYQKIRTLGQGSYGVVMLAVDKQTREKVLSLQNRLSRHCIRFIKELIQPPFRYMI